MTYLRSLRKMAYDALFYLAPEARAKRQIRSIRRRFPEAELRLLPALISDDGRFVDVGAADGLYTVHALQYARSAYAFEPRFRGSTGFSSMSTLLKLPVEMFAVALSDDDGEAVLRVVSESGGLSTIEKSNPLHYRVSPTITEQTVSRKRLDSYDLSDVSLIKIDVEGHELGVLNGARTTITHNRPNIIVEAEERHRHGVIADLMRYFDQMRYRGFFLHEGALVPIERFCAEEHQDPAQLGDWRDGWRRYGIFINNFIFLPDERTPEVMNRIEKLGFPAEMQA
jgi:FkbM family methyltransferase